MSLLGKLRNSLLAKYFYVTTALATPALSCGDPEEGNTSQTYVTQSTGKTNSNGEVSLSGKTFQVKSESKKIPLSDIVVHYFSKDGKGMAMTVDKSKKHSSGFQQLSGGSTTTSLEGEIGTKNLALIDQVLWVKDMVKDIDEEVKKIDHGTFLGSDKNFNKYCMTADQIKSTSVSVPLGLVFLAPKAAGLDWKVLKNNIDKLLGNALMGYITSQFGVQSAYEVHVPKTAVSLCGEDFKDAVCSLTDDRLSKIWDPNKPIWKVVGSCNYKGPVKVCKGGELFCDDFDGSSIDTSKWDVTASDDKIVFKNGVMEVTTSNAAIFDSKNAYTLGNDTYVFEARARVDNNQGVDLSLMLNQSAGGVGFFQDAKMKETVYGSRKGSCSDYKQISLTVTKDFIFRMEVNQSGVTYSVDGAQIIKSNKCIPTNIPLNVDITCQSRDGQPHSCFLDYVKLTKK